MKANKGRKAKENRKLIVVVIVKEYNLRQGKRNSKNN